MFFLQAGMKGASTSGKRARKRYRIGVAETPTGSSASSSSQLGGRKKKSLSEWNASTQDAWMKRSMGLPLPAGPTPEEEAQQWEEWLWGCSPAEDCSIQTLMNRSHLYGLILARQRACFLEEPGGGLAEILGLQAGDRNMLVLFQHDVSEYTLRDLRDAMQNMQIHWVDGGAVDIPRIRDGLDACFHRFGVLSSQEFSEEIMDDQASLT